MSDRLPNDKFLSDIISAYPEWRGREAELTKIIDTLADNRPVVYLDPAVKERIRTTLLSHTQSAADTPRQSLFTVTPSWFLWRLAPLGAVALLIFMVVGPEPAKTVNPTKDAPPSFVATTESGMAKSGGNVDHGVSGAPLGKGGDLSPMFATEAIGETPSVIKSVSTLTVSPRLERGEVLLPYVTMSEPGAVVLHTEPYPVWGEILSVSQPLPVGRTDNIRLRHTPVAPEQIVYVTLVFQTSVTAADLTFVRVAGDQFGQPLSLPITAAD